MKIKKHIPNILTCLNLFCGLTGIFFVLENNFFYGAYFIFLAAALDFLDGFAARILRVHSEIGKQLDSLADMVTFGVVPAFIVFQLVLNQMPESKIPFLAFLIAILSALRLAKFNTDSRQADSFIGVPTPANALLICTLPFLAEKMDLVATLLSSPYLLLAFSLAFSLLLVAELPLIALKFKHFRWKGNSFRYLILGFSLVILLSLGLAGIPFIIILYVILSLLEARTSSHSTHNENSK